MRGHALQDWASITVNAGTTSYTQDDHGWVHTGPDAEATCWIEVSSVTLPTGASYPYVTLQLESAVAPQEELFVPAAGPLLLTSTPPTGPVLVRTVQSVSASGLHQWLRWRIYVPVAGTVWGARFRIMSVPSTRSFFTPLSLAGVTDFFRADLGVTYNSTGQVIGWTNQGPTGDANRNLVLGSGGAPSFTPSNSMYNGRPTINFASASNQFLVSHGTWSSALTQPDTWIVVGHNSGAAAAAQYLIDADDVTTGQQIQYVSTPTTTVTIATAGNTVSYVSSWGNAGVLLGEWNGASSNLYFNASSSPQATGNLGAGSIGSFTLGSANQSTGGGSNWDGSVAEIIGIQGTLSQADKLRLKRYIYGRYALVMP